MISVSRSRQDKCDVPFRVLSRPLDYKDETFREDTYRKIQKTVRQREALRGLVPSGYITQSDLLHEIFMLSNGTVTQNPMTLSRYIKSGAVPSGILQIGKATIYPAPTTVRRFWTSIQFGKSRLLRTGPKLVGDIIKHAEEMCCDNVEKQVMAANWINEHYSDYWLWNHFECVQMGGRASDERTISVTAGRTYDNAFYRITRENGISTFLERIATEQAQKTN